MAEQKPWQKIADEIEALIIKKGVSNFENLAGKTSISELIDLISNVDLFNSNKELKNINILFAKIENDN